MNFMKKVLIITGCLLAAAAVSIVIKELIERDQYTELNSPIAIQI